MDYFPSGAPSDPFVPELEATGRDPLDSFAPLRPRAVRPSANRLSPDGERVAFTAVPADGRPPRLFIRARHDAEARPIAGTDGAKQPFWSPDSRTVAYFARGRLMRVAVDGGSPFQICAAPDARGGAWGAKTSFVFQPLMIFDRVRERLRSMGRGAIGAAVNAAVTDTLGRTIITSGTTLVAVLALYLFGGTVLNGFAFTLLVGIVAGTWSTVFVAAPVAALLARGARL